MILDIKASNKGKSLKGITWGKVKQSYLLALHFDHMWLLLWAKHLRKAGHEKTMGRKATHGNAALHKCRSHKQSKNKTKQNGISASSSLILFQWLSHLSLPWHHRSTWNRLLGSTTRVSDLKGLELAHYLCFPHVPRWHWCCLFEEYTQRTTTAPCS